MSHRSRAIGLVGFLAATAALAGTAVLSGSSPAHAQGYRQMSCGQLWFERNAIYAEFGYCFKTEQAIRAFGPRCYPPYGRLSPRAQDEVDEIKFWERRKDCEG
jgi:hypothetical protein